MKTPKSDSAVLEPPAIDKNAQDRETLIETVKQLEQWGRYNDSHVRRICINALREVGAWEA